MVYLRINEKEPNPNPHINFITALPDSDESNEAARQLLRALAAQIKPVMKKHGFAINSFEEYEWNRVFAGRNWNTGETVEIVLRSQRGVFLSTPWLLNVVCHEVAHIKHMNHSRDFHALWAQLRSEVLELQRKGYYGDGYWSSGQRLSDSARVVGEGFEASELPEYLCGGAQAKSRPKLSKRRHRAAKNSAGPSNHTGVQTAKRRKAGSRVKTEFSGEGNALNEGSDKVKGIGFRKQAQSNRAREERALAAEKRLLALQSKIARDASESESEGDGYDTPQEQDEDRRRTMLDAIHVDDTETSKLAGQMKLEDYKNYFCLPDPSVLSSGSSKSAGSSNKMAATARSEATKTEDLECDLHSSSVTTASALVGSPPLKTSSLKSEPPTPKRTETRDQGYHWMAEKAWSCLVCTLSNHPDHLACDACGTTRGEDQWRN